MQRDPIIIDARSHVVLDGMHRLHALKELGAYVILCYPVVYESKDVKLCRWLRLVKGIDMRTLEKIVCRLGTSMKVSRDEAKSLVDMRKKAIAILTKDSSLVSSSNFRSIEESYKFVREFDRIIREEGYMESFVEEDLALSALSSGDNLLLLPPTLEKKEVLEAARWLRLFPHKSTMHVLKIRPVGVDYPLSELLREKPLGELLTARLSRATIKVIGPPAEHLGRVYKERLLVVE